MYIYLNSRDEKTEWVECHKVNEINKHTSTSEI